MKKRGKKLLSYLLALVLVLGIVPWISLTAKAGDEASTSSDVGGGVSANKTNPTVGDFTFTPLGYITYDGQPHRATVTSDKTGMGNITVKYKIGNAWVDGDPTDAGLYDVYIAVDGSGEGYTATTSDLRDDGWAFEIAKATPTKDDFTFTAPTSLEYDGDEKAANVTSSKTGMGAVTVHYYSDESLSTEVPSPTNIGTYYVAIDVGREGTNYSGASRLHDPSWTFTITEATPPTGDFDFTEPTGPVDMFRLYNPNTGEHFYTGNLSEKDSLINEGWNYEGVAWNAPDFSLTPVYRLYDKNAGTHRYTMDEDKREGFIAEGWSDEGIGWYSDGNETIPVFGLYNKNALQAGAYHFTADTAERDYLISLGWQDEKIGWYGLGEDAA